MAEQDAILGVFIRDCLEVLLPKIESVKGNFLAGYLF